MPVVSAVLTLSAAPERRAALLAELSADPRVSLGPMQRDRLPLVLDTPTRAEDRAAWRSLERHPAVLAHELVFADFSDLHGAPPHPESSPEERAP
ncbi:MAG: hypothetical protein H6740_15010 [Alphaproteobacteria bacterium]|nr:hypothetical protein [Alphaproteobacteria bacterium]